MTELEDIIKCCNTNLTFIPFIGRPVNMIFEIEEAVCPSCNTYYQRKPGKDFAYKAIKDGGGYLYECTKDGGEIMCKLCVEYTPDSGKVIYEMILYCKNHEAIPKFHHGEHNTLIDGKGI